MKNSSRIISAEKTFEDDFIAWGGGFEHGREVHKTGGKISTKTLLVAITGKVVEALWVIVF